MLTAVSVLDSLIRAGMRHVVVSPGSRSAPLAYAIAAAAEAGALIAHVRVDERSAAFTALGIAKASGQPVGLVCTSGTALGEYMPAVMTGIYWLVVMLSVISTGPTFIFNTSNRFVKVWKTEKIPHRVKLFVIALAFLLLCLALSKIGLIAICQKGYTALGNVAIFAIAAPLFVSIFRVSKKDKADAAAQKNEQ